MLRYIDIKSRIKRLIDEAATSAVTDNLNTLVEDVVNASHRIICGNRSWPFLRWPREESFSTVVGQRTYAMNTAVGKLVHVWDSSIRDFLPLIPLRNWDVQNIDRSSQVSNSGAIYGGFWPVAVQPSVAAVVKIVSSSAGDHDDGINVIVQGVTSTGELVEETIEADGVNLVSSTNLFVAILSVSKVGEWIGTMTMSTVADGTLLTLTVDQFGKQYPTLEFVETPAGVKELTYAFNRMPKTLVNDNDIPDIPYPHSEILVYDSLIELSTYITTIEEGHLAIWAARRESLMKQMNEKYDEVNVLGSQPRTVRDLDAHVGSRRFVSN